MAGRVTKALREVQPPQGVHRHSVVFNHSFLPSRVLKTQVRTHSLGQRRQRVCDGNGRTAFVVREQLIWGDIEVKRAGQEDG